jgi:beta-lactamase superfamily II metal-dependent hydrolase
VKLDPVPIPVPSKRFSKGDFIEACRKAPTSLIYFLLNVGDGDTQLILLPGDPKVAEDTRRGIVVDVASNDKLPKLIEALARHDIFPERQDEHELALVVGTHPHDDHIGGMPQFLARFGPRVAEYWDSGYYHPTSSYLETMVHLEKHRQSVQVTQPTSGMSRYLGLVKIVAIAPGVGLRGRFDTYGVNINDASIAIKLEFPACRIVKEGDDRKYERPQSPWSLLLGADVQTTSWAQAAIDFPQLLAAKEVRAGLRDQIGPDALGAQIFKIPHHASKHGVNVELVERVDPMLSLVSSVGGAGRYNFPHHLAIESVREGMQPTTSGQERIPDFDLPIVYTSDRRGPRSRTPLGSIAVIVPAKRRQKLSLWRFGDGPRDSIDLTAALEFKLPKEAS